MVYCFKFIIAASLVLLVKGSFSSIIKQHDINEQYNIDFQLCIKLTILNCKSEEIIFLCDSKNNKMHMMKCLKVNEVEVCNSDSCMKNYFSSKQGLYLCNEIKHKCQDIGLTITKSEFYIPYSHISKIQNFLIFNHSINLNYSTLYNTNINGQKKTDILQRLMLYSGLSRSKTHTEEKHAKFNKLKGNRSDIMKFNLSNTMISLNDLNTSDPFKESEYTQFILSNFTYYPNVVSQQIQTVVDFKRRKMTHITMCIQFFSGVQMRRRSNSFENRKFKSDLTTEEKTDIFPVCLTLNSAIKKFLNKFINIAYLKELPKQSNSDDLEADLEFRCLQNGVHCGDNNVLIHCVPISPDSESELIPLFIFPCKVGAEGNDIISSQCSNDSCSVSVGNETTNLYLLPLLPGSLCEENLGTRCISILLLLICTNNSNLPNYIVDCSGMQQRHNYLQNIRGRCDEMSSSCILDGVSSDWNNATETSYNEETLSVTLSTTLPDHNQTSPSITTSVSTSNHSHPNETISFENYEEVPLIKVSMDLNIQCWKSGWHCYNENILLFCSEELMLYNLTSCPDQYTGKKKSYCNIEMAMCQDLTLGNPLEYTEIEFKCEKTGLQCINEWKLADCGTNMETLFIISCKLLFPLDPRATCNKTTDRCQSLQSDLNLLSTNDNSEDKKDFKTDLDSQNRNKIVIQHENPNKWRRKNKGGSNVVNIKNRPHNHKALRAFKSSKWPIKRIN